MAGRARWRRQPGRGRLLTFLDLVKQDHVAQINYESSSGKITGRFNGDFEVDGQKEFTTQGQPDGLPDQDVATLTEHNVGRNYKPAPSNWLSSFLIYLLPFVLLVGFFVWMSRRAEGQMGVVMNIGRSWAKVYATDKPKTTFADVAGYGPVKEEITEVVDFLKLPGSSKTSARGSRRACCSSARPAPARPYCGPLPAITRTGRR